MFSGKDVTGGSFKIETSYSVHYRVFSGYEKNDTKFWKIIVRSILEPV